MVIPSVQTHSRFLPVRQVGLGSVPEQDRLGMTAHVCRLRGGGKPPHSGVLRTRTSKHAVAEERVDARERFGGNECRRTGRDAVLRERRLRGVRDGLLRERMRKRFEGVVVFEREMYAFVRFDEREDLLGCIVCGSWRQSEPVRIREARGVASHK